MIYVARSVGTVSSGRWFCQNREVYQELDLIKIDIRRSSGRYYQRIHTHAIKLSGIWALQ